MNEDNNVKSRINNEKKRAIGSLTINDLNEAYLFFDKKCPYSGTELLNQSDWHLEHIIPVTMGGTTDSWNCIPICKPCNLSKGNKHLLDWWDLEHEPSEEYKLEKIFIYITNCLNKYRDYKISEVSVEVEKLIEQEIEEEKVIDEDISDLDDLDILFTKKLDTFTFLFQLLNHLNSNKKYIKGNIDEYDIILRKLRSENDKFKKIDLDVITNQMKFTNYLKSIGVTRHYSIPLNYSDKINNIASIKENVSNINQYMNDINISTLINKNPEILFMNIEDFQSRIEYVINVLDIPLNVIIEKPTIINNVGKLKKIVELCKNIDFNFNDISNNVFLRNLDDVIKILSIDIFKSRKELLAITVLENGDYKNIINIIQSEEFKKYPDLFTSTTLAHAKLEDIQKIIQSEEFKKYPDLFASTTLAHAKLEDIQKIIQSEEFKKYPDLFTSTTLAHAKLEDIQKIIQSEEFKKYPDLFTSQTLAHAKLEDIQKIIQSEEFKKYPDLFTSQTLAHAKLEDIQKIIQSEEFKKYPDLFTSQTLAYAKLEDIQKIIQSEEFKKYPDLFTSETLAHAKLEDIQKIIQSEEFKKYPDLFTSQTLSHAKLEDIQKIIQSEEFKKYPDLFTSTTLSHAKLEDIQKIIQSEEFKKYPDLFTSQTLAHAKLEDIQKIIQSEEFKKYPDLFTSETLSHAKLEDIQKIIQSEEFKKYPDLFTSETLACAKLEEIQKILALPYWKQEKYKKLLTASILNKKSSLIESNIELAEKNQISEYINCNYLIKSSIYNQVLISYLVDNDIPIIINNKLNLLFSYQPGALKKKYNIDLKELVEKYSLEDEKRSKIA